MSLESLMPVSHQDDSQASRSTTTAGTLSITGHRMSPAYDRHPAQPSGLDDGGDAGAEQIAGRARTATGEERVRLWPVMTKVFPTYARYAKETAREIPVIVIDRID
ncbi:nitroreductase/quinone reductase family protein [Micromonospora sp. DH14]|uniref:nitroreductase/quinone reductase family protein n=1 Tax=Micromonospora sp. DH14 TaxID=3040120 RepID=UPI0024436133|nr:nitroreductase/quinone reductase family protein [Micromonospora sp. DH14]MDG9676175.1 nitroreductase/quinone reductase family protein [Micromonospora sp. DH14]